MKEKLIERLVRYAKIDTQSDSNSTECPTTPGQWDLLHVLQKELTEIGMEEITLDENGYLFATLPANTDREVPVIGFLAHVDTATDYTGKNVKPQRIDNYDGKDVQLNDNTVMAVKDFPELTNYVGHTLITTDGTTLLGADNKAGIAEIVTAMEYLIGNPELNTENFESRLLQTRKSDVVHINSMSRSSARNMPIQWTVAHLVNFNMKVSMPQAQK